MTTAIGIDIGGTGIKGAIVDLTTGALISDRVKRATPPLARPGDVVRIVREVLTQIGADGSSDPVGICFPAVVRNGRTMSAANVSKEWIGLDALALFSDALGRAITIINDADAAGLAEAHFGAGRGVPGLIIMTTLGTGIGTALLYDGALIPNSELGHLEIDGVDWETRAYFAAKEGEDLDWGEWAARLNRYYQRLEALLCPELFVVGGGVSKNYAEFLPLLDLATPIVPAAYRNTAGILGAAAYAAR